MPHNVNQQRPAYETTHNDQIARVLELRLSGRSLRRVQAELGITHEQARQLEKEALAEYAAANRLLAGERLMQLTGVLETLIDSLMDKAEAGNTQAVEKVIMAADRLSKLWGLDAPATSVNVNATANLAAPEFRIARIQEIINRALERKQATENLPGLPSATGLAPAETVIDVPINGQEI